jgi:hypothetical protein
MLAEAGASGAIAFLSYGGMRAATIGHAPGVS